MSAVLILLLLLIGFWAFVVWDRKRLGEKGAPLSRERMRNGFTPSGAVAWQVSLGLGLMFAALSFLEWQTPSRPPFSGRWSWVNATAYTALGPNGLMVVFAAAAFLAACYGLVLFWSRKQ